jgi:hypothetical protein
VNSFPQESHLILGGSLGISFGGGPSGFLNLISAPHFSHFKGP